MSIYCDFELYKVWLLQISKLALVDNNWTAKQTILNEGVTTEFGHNWIYEITDLLATWHVAWFTICT